MGDSNKPREFWIAEEGMMKGFAHTKPVPGLHNGIHVLEAAPVIAELKRLRKALSSIATQNTGAPYDLWAQEMKGKAKQALAESEWVEGL